MWLVPTRNLSEYCFKVIESYCDEYPVEAVIMEEPDFMRAAGYSKAFRDAWKEYYEEESGRPGLLARRPLPRFPAEGAHV